MGGIIQELSESELLSELLLGKDILIKLRICKRVGLEGEKGVYSRRYRA